MNSPCPPHAREPRWQPARHLRRALLTAGLRDWLLDNGSLTRRLQGCCGGRFDVELVSQGWERPHANEVRRLGLPRHERALVRQVYLRCDGRRWVFARTVIPLSSLRGRQRRLLHLGNRPLGAVLFADPHMRREPLEVARVCPGIRLQRRVYFGDGPADGSAGEPGDEVVWGRRSVFRLDGGPLLVSEFFLPRLLDESRVSR